MQNLWALFENMHFSYDHTTLIMPPLHSLCISVQNTQMTQIIFGNFDIKFLSYRFEATMWKHKVWQVTPLKTARDLYDSRCPQTNLSGSEKTYHAHFPILPLYFQLVKLEQWVNILPAEQTTPRETTSLHWKWFQAGCTGA